MGMLPNSGGFRQVPKGSEGMMFYSDLFRIIIMRNPFESERKIFSKIKNPTREKIPALHQTNSTGEASKTSSKQNLIQDEASRKKNQIESYQMADINFSAHSGFRGHFEAKVSENKIIEESKALQMRYEVS